MVQMLNLSGSNIGSFRIGHGIVHGFWLIVLFSCVLKISEFSHVGFEGFLWVIDRFHLD